MEILLRVKCLQRLAIPRPVRALHRDYGTATPQNFADYDSMKRDFKLEVPEYFNFAGDVLDKWTDMEKVQSKGQSNYSFQLGVIFAPKGHLAKSGDNFVATTWGTVVPMGAKRGCQLNIL